MKYLRRFDEGKSRACYFERDGRFYVQHTIFSHKYGYAIPQGKKRISKAEFEKMINLPDTEIIEEA